MDQPEKEKSDLCSNLFKHHWEFWIMTTVIIGDRPDTPRHTNLTVISNTMCQLMHPKTTIKKLITDVLYFLIVPNF